MSYVCCYSPNSKLFMHRQSFYRMEFQLLCSIMIIFTKLWFLTLNTWIIATKLVSCARQMTYNYKSLHVIEFFYCIKDMLWSRIIFWNSLYISTEFSFSLLGVNKLNDILYFILKKLWQPNLIRLFLEISFEFSM